MLTAMALVLLLVLFALGTQIAIGMAAVATVLMLLLDNVPAVVIAQTAFKSVNSYALVAIPFFVLAGDLMMRGNLAAIIVELVGSVVRAAKGGLALTVMAAAVFFAAVSGSSVAGAAAIGRSTVSSLRAENYPAHFAAGLVAVAGTQGLMIPPSLSFIIIGSIVGLPIDKLFIAGIVPGLMEAAPLTLMTAFLCRRNGYGIEIPRPDWMEFSRRLPAALPAVFMPVLVIGSIYGGIFTPTEVSAVAAAYAALLCWLVYRSTTLRELWESSKHSLLATTMIYFIVIGGSLISFLLTRMGFASEITALVDRADLPPWVFLLIVNVILLILGMFLDGISMIVLTAPVLFPAATALGINPIHLAVIVTANVEIATLTRPSASTCL
jgi:C4-dicarboxylate transporter DctM subunit